VYAFDKSVVAEASGVGNDALADSVSISNTPHTVCKSALDVVEMFNTPAAWRASPTRVVAEER
jgi:hypothetical protein